MKPSLAEVNRDTRGDVKERTLEDEQGGELTRRVELSLVYCMQCNSRNVAQQVRRDGEEVLVGRARPRLCSPGSRGLSPHTALRMESAGD